MLLEKNLERREAAEQLDRATRGSGKRQRFPQGHLFNPNYRELYAEQLAERRREEEGRRRTRRRAAQATPHADSANLDGKCILGTPHPF